MSIFKRQSSISRIASILGATLSLAAVVYFLMFAFQQWNSIPLDLFTPQILFFLVGMATLYLLVIIFNGWAWHLLLVASGEVPKLLDSLIIFVQSQFAKYIPGNFAQHLGRVALARAYGLHIPSVVFIMAIEIAWMILASSSLGAVSFLSLDVRGLGVSGLVLPVWKMIAMAVIAIILPIVGTVILARWRPSWIDRFFPDGGFKRPGAAILIVVYLIYVMSLAAMGWMADSFARTAFHVPQSYILITIGIYALAWVAGFLTPGAPAGIGIREVILAAAFTQLYGESIALGITLSLRAVTMAGDVLAFLIGSLARGILKSKIVQSSSST